MKPIAASSISQLTSCMRYGTDPNFGFRASISCIDTNVQR